MLQYLPLLLLIPLMGGVAATVVVVAFRTRAQTRDAIQQAKAHGSKPCSQTGGGQLGWLYATMPFASIVVSPEQVVMTVAGKRSAFTKASVHTIKRYRSMFSNGVRIEHDGVSGASPAIFWSTDPNGLLNALKNMDWPVED